MRIKEGEHFKSFIKLYIVLVKEKVSLVMRKRVCRSGSELKNKRNGERK